MENDKCSWQVYEGLWISFRSKDLRMFSTCTCYYATCCPLLLFLLLLCAHHFLSSYHSSIKKKNLLGKSAFENKKSVSESTVVLSM